MSLLRKYIWLWVIVGMIFVSGIISLIFILINKCLSRRGKLRLLQLQRSDIKTESNKYQQTSCETPPLPPRTQFITAGKAPSLLLKIPRSLRSNRKTLWYSWSSSLSTVEQFVISAAQSYENLAEDHDYEETTDQQSNYVKEENKTEILRPLPPYDDPDPDMKLGVSVGQSYENLAEDHDYEQCTDEQPDYVKVDNETEILRPLPPYDDPDPDMKLGVSVGQSYENLAEDHDYEQCTDEQPDYVKVEAEDSATDNVSTEDYDDIGCEKDDQSEEDYDDVN
ncbi:uncharacterized protein [Brachyistius frenatus]|uniref:uncharacterized protein n=1 Tax=Brachyistius frenatus TaxID=100188 RepID=UPI0037E70F66